MKITDGYLESKSWTILSTPVLIGFCFISRVQKIQSDKARKNFDSEKNMIFDLKAFRKSSIIKVYDSLHGISTDVVELSEAVEILAYCLMDGKVDQKSSFETCLYNDLLEQLKNNEVKQYFQFSVIHF